MTTAGAVAGAISTFVFVVVHDILISDIWDMAVLMLVAGALCGALLTWRYDEMTERHSIGRWGAYVGTVVALLGLIPLLSIVVFDPVTAFEEVVALDGPPGDLIGTALPFTIVVTVVVIVTITRLFGDLRRHLGSNTIAIVVLMVLLGLNLTVVGLVEFSGTEGMVVVGFMGLVVLLGTVFAVVMPIVHRILTARS